MIAAAPPPPPPPLLPPPAIQQPAPFEASYGLVSGTAPAAARRIIVRVNGSVLADKPLAQPRFTVQVELPPGESQVKVTVIAKKGRRSSRTIGPVLGLPSAATPRFRSGYEDGKLARLVTRLTRAFGPASGVYVQSLTSGAGAAWNASARFPAASTLKLAVAVAVLTRLDGLPPPGSWLDGQLRRLLTLSDDRAANSLEVWLGGSTSSGGRIVTSLMHSLGLTNSEMYGGYTIERTTSASIPRRVEEQPWFGRGKFTTAADLAGLARAVWLASGNVGPLRSREPGFTRSDARHLLYLLGRVLDRGKLDRRLSGASRVTVLHKAGWISTARHDAGLVFWPGGVFVAAVMTWAPRGVGLSSDVLAGNIAWSALQRLRE